MIAKMLNPKKPRFPPPIVHAKYTAFALPCCCINHHVAPTICLQLQQQRPS